MGSKVAANVSLWIFSKTARSFWARLASSFSTRGARSRTPASLPLKYTRLSLSTEIETREIGAGFAPGASAGSQTMWLSSCVLARITKNRTRLKAISAIDTYGGVMPSCRRLNRMNLFLSKLANRHFFLFFQLQRDDSACFL